MSNLIPTLAQIDSRILIGIAVVAVVAFIWSVVKKAFKAGIILLIVVVFAGIGVPAVNNLRENYGVTYNKVDEILTFKVAGKDTEISLKEIKEAKNYTVVFEQGTSDTKLNLFYERKDGTAVSEKGSNSIKIPNFMAEILRKYLDSAGITYKLEQSTGVLG